MQASNGGWGQNKAKFWHSLSSEYYFKVIAVAADQR